MLDMVRWSRGMEWAWAAYRVPFAHWDHDHCEVCSHTLVDPAYGEDYSTRIATDDRASGHGFVNRTPHDTRGAHWLCEACFTRHRARMGWTLGHVGAGEWPYLWPRSEFDWYASEARHAVAPRRWPEDWGA